MYGRRPEARDWVWKSSRRWPPSGWRVRCSLMPAAMLEIHGAALRVLWGLPAGGQSITTVRQAPPVGAIDYRLHAHHDQKKDRARQPPATLAPSHPKPLHAGNSQAPACGAPASRQRVRPQTWPAAFAFLARQATASRGKGRPDARSADHQKPRAHTSQLARTPPTSC